MKKDYNRGWSEGWSAAKTDSAILEEKYPQTAKRENAYYAELDEWKPLEIDNLPPDILTGDYEFERYSGAKSWVTVSNKCSGYDVIRDCQNMISFRYHLRKHEPDKTVYELATDYFMDSGKEGITEAYIAGYNKAKEIK